MAESTSTQTDRKMHETRIGRVVTDVRNKTIKVRYEYRYTFPKYGKIIRRTTTLHAHDEKNEAKVGDTVEVAACRPMSKTKCWRLVRIVTRPAVA